MGREGGIGKRESNCEAYLRSRGAFLELLEG